MLGSVIKVFKNECDFDCFRSTFFAPGATRSPFPNARVKTDNNESIQYQEPSTQMDRNYNITQGCGIKFRMWNRITRF